MSPTTQARVSRRPRFPVVWLVPVVTLAVGGWMVLREFHKRGSDVMIHFPDGSGIEVGKTALVHKGVPVGIVRDVTLEKDLHGVVVKLQLDKDAGAFARGGSQFWIVRPELSFSGVRGLETLIAGVQLNGRPGSGSPAKEFTGLERRPAPEDTQLGRAFLLRADKLGSLTTGSPVYYREVKVGAVESSRLANDAAGVLIRIRIHTPYVEAVRTNTQFWNAGGIALKLSLLGAELKITSLESLFSGGVGFATPDKERLAPAAEDGAQFTLHEDQPKESLKWQPHIPIKPEDSEPERSPRATNVPAALKG